MFKNWKAICEILDTHFMWAIALLDLATDFGQLVASRFPEYFTDEQQAGPIPMSVLFRQAAENYAAGIGEFTEEFIVSQKAAEKFNIPIIAFGIDPEASNGFDVQLLPIEIEKEALEHRKTGDTLTWRDKKITLLEYNEHIGIFYFAPAECIDVNR
jgi:hypothetical protein